MNNEIDKKERWEKVLDFMYRINIFVVIVFIVLILCLPLLMSCHTNDRIVEVVRTDTLIQTKVQRDSIYVENLKHDSVYIHQKGDTLLIEKWHTEWRDRWRDREKHDTLYIARHDTIRKTITKTDVIRKEKELTWWQKIRLSLGNVFLWVLVIMAVVFGVKYIIMKVVRP